MRLAVLTNQTLHHSYFVRELVASWPIKRVFVETRSAKQPFETAHPFEALRDAHEKKIWFGGASPTIEHFAETIAFTSMNEPSAVQALRELRPEVVIVFGTRKLSVDVISTCPKGIINLHGGDPEEYRGLDTHLWAIFHNAFDELVTTLHHVNAVLDDGDIIAREPILLSPGMKLHQLRQLNSEVCVKLVKAALVNYEKTGSFPAHTQTKRGRSYSFMPTSLKDLCVSRFENFTKTL